MRIHIFKFDFLDVIFQIEIKMILIVLIFKSDTHRYSIKNFWGKKKKRSYHDIIESSI